jgi:hypothetical protein
MQKNKMRNKITKDQWVWILVQEPGLNEKFLGHHDPESDESYIPTFLDKEDALKCFNIVTKKDNRNYETQAILFEDLCSQAADNGFKLYVLDGAGEIIEKIEP